MNYIQKCEFALSEIKNILIGKNIDLVQGGKSFTHINNKCNSSNLKHKKIAFIIPYRDRLPNLKVFLNNMHPFLVKQKINYGIYLVEPMKGVEFNRGLLLNIGFIESIRDVLNLSANMSSREILAVEDPYWDCWIMHDVDMIPEDERMIYTCDNNYPLHLAVAVSKFDYKFV